MGKGEYGVADNLARARGISVESVKHAGVVESAAGKVRLFETRGAQHRLGSRGGWASDDLGMPAISCPPP